MAESTRGFQAIAVEIAGVQPGHMRFVGADNAIRSDGPAPKVARHRNNLTALSQYRNLYIVACRDRIHLFEPRFPAQTLPNRPVFSFRLPVSRSGLQGDLSYRHPHSVNRLLLDDLGDEETLACVCDDGDVLLYHMTSIVGAMQRSAHVLPAEIDRSSSSPRPLFHENVGRSAWGIAMHKTRRMLAVSNNKKVIDVIAFALRDPGHESGAEEEPGQERAISRNIHVRLQAHVHNIPSVAFCSNEWDPDGRWLVSIDITGLMIVWSIWDGTPLMRRRWNEPALGGHAWGYGLDRYGWGVLCLDATAAKQVVGFRQKYGLHPAPPRRTPGVGMIDISATRQDVDDFSARFTGGSGGPGGGAAGMDDVSSSPDAADEPPAPLNPNPEDPNGDEDIDPAIQDLGSAGSGELMEIQEYLGDEVDWTNVDTLADFGEVDDFNGMEGDQGDDEGDGDYQDDEEADEEEVADETSSAGSDTPVQGNLAGPQEGSAHNTVVATSEEIESAATPGDTQAPGPPLPRFAVLCTSDDSIRLLTAPDREPAVVCHRPLSQQLSGAALRLSRNERLNMVQEVPELSMIVVACQTGRVALFRLTRDLDEPGVGLRLEHILPTASQEREGHRPARPLLGIAIGPIQGREKLLGPDHIDMPMTTRSRQELWRRVEPTRRYRLMLTYLDHTVLAYEIGRTRPSAAASAITVDTPMAGSSNAGTSGGQGPVGLADENDLLVM